MCPRLLIFLIGAVYIYHQALAQEDIYFAELMVESNITLDAQTILSILNATTDLQVTDSQGVTYTVTLLQNELVAECLIIGIDTTCNCSTGYTWSNDVCYNYSCCNDSSCTANVSYITPLCVPKVNVLISGSVMLSAGTWGTSQTALLQAAFQVLNAFQYLNVTGQRQGNSIADFEASVNAIFETSFLQGIVTSLENSLTAVIWVNTLGMVNILYPNSTVCYLSSPILQCTFEEATGSAGWNLTRQDQRFELSNGSVVLLDSLCATPYYKSCIAIKLQLVTGAWEGIYECGFTTGSVRHTARAQLNVALLPDTITMLPSPLIGDCSTKLATDSAGIDFFTIIPNSTETYKVWWSYRGVTQSILYNTSVADTLVYTFTAQPSCQTTLDPQYVNVTFENPKGQQKTARADIPVIYAGSIICTENGTDVFWPNTPAGSTVINRTCAEGRVGYMSRTCIGPTWQPVYDYCINQQLNAILNKANNFLMGLGATQEMAMNIFAELSNNTSYESTDNIADITASITVLNTMAMASSNFVLQENVFPSFIEAASNLLNKTWAAVNETTLYSMSSTYLEAVEVLVERINVNNSQGFYSANIELDFCFTIECNVTVFGIDVSMTKANGILKTAAIKNLMDKLRNGYTNMNPTSLLLSATLQDNNDSSLEISMNFPIDPMNKTTPFCVFWNFTKQDWSNVGCTSYTSDDNHTLCECNHLTSFSVLMSKGEIPVYGPALDMITNVGLAVSILSLLIFLTVECLVWSAVVKSNLSHFRHTAMVNIATFLLLADISFLASTSPSSISESSCLLFTICKHLFYLAMFCWMLCLSVMLVHQLIFVFSPLRKRVFMFISSIVGYALPILIVGSSYVYYKYTNTAYYNRQTCWLIYVRLLVGSMHAFLLPVAAILFTNLFCMIVVIVTLVKSSVPDASKADDKETAKSIMKVVIILTPVFGVTWIFGYFQLILNQDNPLYAPICFSFTIFNCFQGLFILITGCFAEQKVREELLKKIMVKFKGHSDSTKNLTTTTYTKDK
ncbi:adhesion G-protein coupled receptor F3-like [Betta splendens]|uniref:Adhesion G-protein coupled receptor F3-like n=1 Tax=Betta splendens TaxID=158456 RepID=A0A9W2XKQ3_BETSP|nr:adhesion G-protein coupled receptor F3-like [Betta splendens]